MDIIVSHLFCGLLFPLYLWFVDRYYHFLGRSAVENGRNGNHFLFDESHIFSLDLLHHSSPNARQSMIIRYEIDSSSIIHNAIQDPTVAIAHLFRKWITINTDFSDNRGVYHWNGRYFFETDILFSIIEHFIVGSYFTDLNVSLYYPSIMFALSQLSTTERISS